MQLKPRSNLPRQDGLLVISERIHQMKQIVKIRRIETLKVELEVIQPLAKSTLTTLFNTSSPLGAPGQRTLGHEVTDFEVIHLEPKCECEGQVKKKKGRG